MLRDLLPRHPRGSHLNSRDDGISRPSGANPPASEETLKSGATFRPNGPKRDAPDCWLSGRSGPGACAHENHAARQENEFRQF